MTDFIEEHKFAHEQTSTLLSLSTCIIDDTICKLMYADHIVLCIYKGPFTNYINATNLCKNDNKRFDNWLKNDKSNELIKLVNNEISTIKSPPIKVGDGTSTLPEPSYKVEDEITTSCFHVIVGGTNTEIRGTYVHPDLLPHILCWLSPKFALKVSKIVYNYYSMEKDKKLRTLDTLLEETKKNHEETKRGHTELLRYHIETTEKLDKLTEKNEIIIDCVQGLAINTLDCKRYTNIPVSSKQEEQLVILELTYQIKGEEEKGYMVHRCQRGSFVSTHKACLARFSRSTKPDTDVIVTPLLVIDSPNAVNSWSNMRVNFISNFSVQGSRLTLKHGP